MLLSRKIILLALIASIGLALVSSMDVRGGALEDFDAFIKEKEKEKEFISYSQEEWNKMRDEKEQGIFIIEEELLAPPKVEKVEKVKPEEEEAVPPLPGGIGIILPFESRLSISGQKRISMKYGAVFYKDEEERTTTGTPVGVTEGFDMDQELQVKIKGNVGTKITVNVDYDDTVEDKRDISVVYKGDPDEIVQEAAFGDITLELPATEFVAYKKSVFGGKLNMQYKEFKLMAIGSQTKGIPEEKKFKGKSTFEKRDINDTSYRRRKYYELWDINIQSGTEEVYIDDRDGTNNQNGADMMVRNEDLSPSTTYYGYFNLQVPGQDYTIDYIKGIITFRKTIYENYVIAMDYKKSDGSWLREENINQEPKILKDEDEDLDPSQEMMNYYDLGRKKIIQGVEGRDFIVKILDLNRKEVPEFLNAYDIIEMDYDEGILKFKDRTPFDPPYSDIYNKTNPQHHYIIYMEYKYRQKEYFLRPNIVEGSEKITLNGRLLKRDEDYFIDYESGWITFFREEEIDEETEVKISYEYMPFAGLFQETLLGARGEWAPTDRFFLGSTILYSGAAKAPTIPSVRATPGSKLILDVNSEFSFDPQPFFPFKTKISGELARSLNNPNTWGKAIIDSMEGVKLIDGMPTDKDVWQIASNPGRVVTEEGAISWDNEDEKSREIKQNPDIPEGEEQEVLKITYDLKGTDEEASIVYPISTRGVDYSQKESLELYVYGDNNTEILEITLGTIAEDADVDGNLDTEDINGDGTLNVGEDVGWDFLGWTDDDEKIYLKDGKIGYKNGKIDTEDLDGDGGDPEPDKGDGGSFSTTINWSGRWQKVSWDLGITTDTASNWTAIKHIRITLKGTDVSGSIKIASIGVVGNKWERGVVRPTGSGNKFSVGAVNTEDDIDYGRGLLDNNDYKDLYGERLIEEREVEQALSLKYTLISGATGYTKWTFTRAEDYSKYEKLKFFIKKKPGGSGEPAFIMRLGTLSDHYQFETRADWKDWKLITINLEDIDGKYGADTMKSSDGTITRKGTPVLTNIPEIKLMIVNDTMTDIAGEIWVNEIHLTGARKKEGWAGRIGLDCELPDWFTFGGKYWYMDRNFETITVPSKNQDKEVISAYTNFNRLSYLPLSLDWSKTTTITPSAVRVADLSVQDEGRVVSHQGSASTELRLPKLPRLGISYGKNIVERSQPEGKREDSDTYSGTLYQYQLPVRFFLFPHDLGGSYKRITKFNKFTSTAPTQENFHNFREFTNDWSGKATFRPLSELSIVPSYSLRKVRERVYADEKINRPRSGTQTAGFNSTLQFFEWLKPSISYSITNTENFIIVTSTSIPEEKNFTRSSSAKLSLPFVAKSLFPKFKPVASLNVNSSYALNDGDSYEKIREDYPIYGKLWLRGKGMGYKRLEGIEEDELKSFSLRDTFRMESNWKPLEFLDLKGYLYPFQTMSTRIEYTRTQSHQGPTILDSEKRIWPYLDIRMKNLEKFPLLGLAMQEVEMITKYILTREYARNVSSGTTVNFSEDLRFKLFEDYYFWLTYSSSRNRVKSAPSWEISQEGFSRAYNAQITFTWWKDWRFNLKYGYKKEEGETGGEKTTESRIYTPSIDVEAHVKLPELWKIPIIGKRVRTAGEMKVKARVSAEIKRSELNVERDNTDTYSTLLSSDFNVGTNLMLTVGTGMTFFVNHVLDQNNYFAVDISTTLTIKF